MPKENEKKKNTNPRKVIKGSVYGLCGFRRSAKKRYLVKITPKDLTQRKTLSADLQDTHGILLMIVTKDVVFVEERIVEKFFNDLKELGTEIINFEEKK